MPTYEYECQKCHYTFEKFQSMKEDPLKTCPECKKDKLKRLIGTGAGIIFKGNGFYETDYRSESYKKEKDKEKKSEKSSTEKKSKDTKKKESTSSSTGSKIEKKAS